MYGRTEDVFSPEDKQAPHNRKNLRDILCGSTTVASIEQPPDTMLLQMKRPLDMNSLEKGPPSAKLPKVVAETDSNGMLFIGKGVWRRGVCGMCSNPLLHHFIAVL